MRGSLLLPVVLALAACVPAKKPAPEQAQVAAPLAWRAPQHAPGSVQDDWWRSFGDAQLDALVAAALAHNTDLLLAASRVEEAQAQIALARAALLPSAQVALPLQRDQTLGTTGVLQESIAQPELQLAYELDLWGRLRALRGSAELQYRATQAERDAARLSIAGATARAYITLRSLDHQLTVTEQTAASRREALQVAQDRAGLGYTSQLELSQAESEYQAAAQLIPQFRQAIRQQENALRLLVGTLPGAVVRGRDIAALRLPAVPGMLPSELLRRRPDIQQGELQLAAADRYLDARRAEFLPSVQLSAGVGRLYVDALDYDPVKIWYIGASVLAPLFSGGRLTAQVNAATAQRDQAAYAYRGNVLNAFGEVENALSGVQQYAAQIERVRARVEVLRRSLGYAHDRYVGGYSSFLEELDAQRNLFDMQLAAIQLREAQLNNLVQLYQALGGGWQATGG